jgi:hypothetical protein
VDRGSYLGSIEEIPEPHAFTARVRLKDDEYELVFEEHERRRTEARCATTTCGLP